MSVQFRGANGGRLVGSVYGSGPRTALLLHGGGQTRHSWERTASRLAERGWRAVALDQRGHGDSDRAPDGAYAFWDFGADAAAVGDALAGSGEAAIVVGASLGGIAGLLALGRAGPPVFAGLILVDIVPRMNPSGVAHVQGFMRANAREGFATIEEAAEAVARYLPHRARPRSLEGLRKNLRLGTDGRWRWHWDPRFLDGPRPVTTDAEAVETALEESARKLRVPTLLVRGTASELVSEQAARSFCDLAPGAELVDVAHARHMVAGDRNDVFGDAVEGFLERHFPLTQ